MTFFEWQSWLELGIATVDDQHQGLVDLMNELYERAARNDPHPEIMRVFDELANRTREHFAAEEQYMLSIGYDGLASHQLMHAKLLKRLDDSRRAVVEAKSVPPEVFEFLKFWLRSHIAGIDTKYAAVGAS